MTSDFQVSEQVKLHRILLNRLCSKVSVRVGRQVKNAKKTSDVICECSPRTFSVEHVHHPNIARWNIQNITLYHPVMAGRNRHPYTIHYILNEQKGSIGKSSRSVTKLQNRANVIYDKIYNVIEQIRIIPGNCFVFKQHKCMKISPKMTQEILLII